MQGPPPQQQRTSALFVVRDIDEADDLETQWSQHFKAFEELVAPLAGEREVNSVLLAKVSENMDRHAELTCALLYGILTADATKAAQYLRYLSFVVRDAFAFLVSQFSQFITEKYPKASGNVRTQLLWLLSELIRMNIHDSDTLLALLMRHIIGGDVSAKNLWLLQQVLSLLVEQRPWLLTHAVLIPTVVYMFLRLIPDHMKSQFSELRDKEVAFTTALLRERFADCKVIGRDLVRLLIDVAKIPEFEALWHDVLSRPAQFGLPAPSTPSQSPLSTLLSVRTPRKFLQGRLTPEMETQILFVLAKVKITNQKRYQKWFAARWLTTAESDSLIVDLVRYIVCVYHPPNHILSSDVVPRWAFIGWLMRCIRSVPFAANAKLALFFDWLFFDPKTESLMNLEPALLLMAHSSGKFSAATASLLEFLALQMEFFDPPRQVAITACVNGSFKILLEKGVLPNLETVLNCAGLDPVVRSKLRKLLPSFYADLGLRSSGPLSVPVAKDSTDKKAAVTATPAAAPSPPSALDEEMKGVVSNAHHSSNGSVDEELRMEMNDADASFSDDNNGKVDQVMQENVKEETKPAAAAEGEAEAPAADPAEYVESSKKFIASVGRDDFAAASALVDALRPAFLRSTPPTVSHSTLTALQGFSKYTAPLLVRALRSLPALPLRAVECIAKDDSTRKFYAMLLEHAGLPPRKVLYEDCKALHATDATAFLAVVPALFRFYSASATGNQDLLYLVISSLDPANLYALCSSIMLHGMSVLGDQASAIVAASLSWEAFEQYSLWQILRAEIGGRAALIEKFAPGFLANIDPETHSEALTALLLLLRDLPPSLRLLSTLFALPPSFHTFVASLLSVWSQTQGATLLSRLIELSYVEEPPLDVPSAAAHVQFWRQATSLPSDIAANKLFAKFLAHVRLVFSFTAPCLLLVIEFQR